MGFSERNGYKPLREIIQIENIDNDLKTALWNAYKRSIDRAGSFDDDYFNSIDAYNLYPLYMAYWDYIFKKPIDDIPDTVQDSTNQIREYFFNQLKWYEIYEFIELTISYFPSTAPLKYKAAFITFTNRALEQENSAYRIINEQIIKITSEQEIQSIKQALESTNPYSGVQQHLNQALQLMSHRQNPDYRNSIKESISAVEGMCRIISGDKNDSFKKALAKIETKHQLHSSLKEGFNKLYSYTSDADGIRHAMLEESNLSYIDAKFMLVACTNFINYLIDKTKE